MNTLASLALIKVIWDKEQKSPLDMFIPLIATLIKVKNYQTFQDADLRHDFQEMYGIKITTHPMISMINRCRNINLCKSLGGAKYAPIYETVNRLECSAGIKEQHDSQEVLVSSFIRFCEESHSYVITTKRAESVFIEFFNHYGATALMNSGILAVPEPAKEPELFMLSEFVVNLAKTNNILFQSFARIYLGHLLAATVMLPIGEEKSNVNLNLNIYFDTSIILSLLGLHGEAEEETAKELLIVPSKCSLRFYVFEHVIQEAGDIIQGALHLLQNPAMIDYSKATRVLRQCIRSGTPISDLEFIYSNLHKKLSDMGITSYTAPAVDNPIDINKLHSIVSLKYQSDKNFDAIKRENVIDTDTKSIENIYYLRKGYHCNSFSKCSYLFVTSNSVLASASREFHANRNEIPPCVTDVFLGTMIWINYRPAETKNHEKRLVAACSTILHPSSDLWLTFINEVEKLKSAGKVDEESYRLLKDYKVSSDLLAHKTLGAIDNLNEKTTDAILEELLKKGEEKYSKEVQAHLSTKKQLEKVVQEKESVADTVKSYVIKGDGLQKKFQKKCHLMAIIIIVLLYCGIFGLGIWQLCTGSKILGIILLGFSIISLFVPPRYLKNKIAIFMYKVFYG